MTLFHQDRQDRPQPSRFPHPPILLRRAKERAARWAPGSQPWWTQHISRGSSPATRLSAACCKLCAFFAPCYAHTPRPRLAGASSPRSFLAQQRACKYTGSFQTKKDLLASWPRL